MRPLRTVATAAVLLLAAWGVIASTNGLRRPTRRVRPGGPTAAGWHEDASLVTADGPRLFRYYVPANVRDPTPVVVLLHGGGQSMRKIFRPRAGGTREWPAVADDEGFLLLVPNGVDPDSGDPAGDSQHWNDCRDDIVIGDSSADDVAFVAALLDWAAATFRVDAERLYATGASNGGMMSYRLAVELADRLAAVAVFVANLPADSECGRPSRPLPVLLCNGTDDLYMPWSGGAVAGGDRGTVISAQATLNVWLDADDAGPDPVEVTELADLDPGDGCRVLERRWQGAAEVVFLTVDGGGHTMPSIQHEVPAWIRALLGLGNQSRDVEGARAAWQFLERQRRRPAATAAADTRERSR